MTNGAHAEPEFLSLRGSSRTYLLLIACLLALTGIAWLAWARLAAPTTQAPQVGHVEALTPGVAATMDSLPFTYSPGWQVTALGADPPEPQGPWKIVTLDSPFDEADFELFNVVTDPGETTNLATAHPEKYAELISLWRTERRRLGIVLPQDL